MTTQDDTTMLDALEALEALEALKAGRAEGASLAEALRRSAQAAEHGARATTPLVARTGRANYLGERITSQQDTGATSAFILLKAAAWSE